MSTTGPEVRRLLVAWKSGDPAAFSQLFPLIYDELRAIAGRCFAGERRGHTLQPTALIAEVYLVLANQRPGKFESKKQLLAFLATVMRRILIDHARQHRAEKRWGRLSRRPLAEAVDRPLSWHPEETIAFHEALERLAELDPRQARIVELRLIGLKLKEIVEIVKAPRSTVHRELETAKLWLRAALDEAWSKAEGSPCSTMCRPSAGTRSRAFSTRSYTCPPASGLPPSSSPATATRHCAGR